MNVRIPNFGNPQSGYSYMQVRMPAAIHDGQQAIASGIGKLSKGMLDGLDAIEKMRKEERDAARKGTILGAQNNYDVFMAKLDAEYNNRQDTDKWEEDYINRSNRYIDSILKNVPQEDRYDVELVLRNRQGDGHVRVIDKASGTARKLYDQSWTSAYKYAIDSQNYDEAKQLVNERTDFTPEQKEFSNRGIDLIQKKKGLLEQSSRDPFGFQKTIDSSDFLSLPFDTRMEIKSANEKDVREAKQEIRDEYTNQLFKNIKLDEKKLQSDVDSGRVDPSFALSIRAAEVRRTKAIEAEKASDLETYTDPKDYAEFEAKLSAYDPSNDPGGKQLTELETFLNTGQFGKIQRELFTSDLKDMRNGKVPARLSGHAGEIRKTLNEMHEQQRLGQWKRGDGTIDTREYDKSRLKQYNALQYADSILKANPKIGYEELLRKVTTRIGDNIDTNPFRFRNVKDDFTTPNPAARPSSRLNLPSSSNAIREQLNKSGAGATPGLSANASASAVGLSQYLNDFEDAGREYGIDPNFLLSIARLETGNGTSSAFLNKNNAMGVSPRGGGPRAYSSVRESIFDAARNLKKNYIDRGLFTIEAIGRKYSPPGAANDPHGTNSGWASNVTKVYRELTGKSELDLSFGNVPLETQALTMLNSMNLKGFPRDAAVQSFVNELAKNHKIEPGQYSGLIRMVNDKWDVDNA